MDDKYYNNFLSFYKKNLIDYNDYKKQSYLSIKNINKKYEVNIIIPYKNRFDNLITVLHSISLLKTKYKFIVTIIELDLNKTLQIKNLRKKFNKIKINYIFIPQKKSIIFNQFNKSLAMNCAFLWSNQTDWYIFHDVDLIVKEDFLENCFENIKRTNCNILQTYGNRCVFYINDKRSNVVRNNVELIKKLELDNDTITKPHILGSPGGSLMVKSEIFRKVGGYDPSLFWGYAPEDAFILEKMKLIGKFDYCDKPINDLFHLYHPITVNSNPYKRHMNEIYCNFKKMNNELKNKFIKEISKYML